MASARTPELIAESFIAGTKAPVKLASMFARRNELYSYGPHFPLILKEADGTLFIATDKPSTTTARHVNACHRSAVRSGYQDTGHRFDRFGITYAEYTKI